MTDGFIVRRRDAARMTSYEAIAAAPMRRSRRSWVTFSVRRRSVPACWIVEFSDQEAAVEAVRRGAVDALASTAIGNGALVERANDSTFAAVATTSRRPERKSAPTIHPT